MDHSASTRCLYFAKAYQSSDSTRNKNSSSSNSYRNKINLNTKSNSIKNISNIQRVDEQTIREPFAKHSHKDTPSFLRSSFRKVSLFTENRMFKLGHNKCTANFKESECSQQIWSFTYSQMNTNKRDRAEKMTYCRPKRKIFNDEHLNKALEDKLKLQSLVKKLAETREKEKNTSVWRSYIKELKLRHGMISKHSKRYNKERHTPNVNIPKHTLEKYYRTQYDPVHANRFDCLLHDIYKNNSTIDTGGVVSMDLNRDTDSVSEETDQFIQKLSTLQDNKRCYTPISMCYPTSSQALKLMRTESSTNHYCVHRPCRCCSLKQHGKFQKRYKTRYIYQKTFDDKSYDSDNSPNQPGQQSSVTDNMYSNSPRYRGCPIIIKSESRNGYDCYKKCGNDECSLQIVREISNENNDRERRNSLEVQTDARVINSKLLSAISFYGLADEVKTIKEDIDTTKVTSCNQQVLDNINEKLSLLVKVVLSLTKRISDEKNELNPSDLQYNETNKPNNIISTNSYGLEVEKEDKTARNNTRQQVNTETFTDSNDIYKDDNSNTTQPVSSKNYNDENKDLPENENFKSAPIEVKQEIKIEINQENDITEVQSFTKCNESDVCKRVSDVNLLLKHLRRKIDDLHKMQTQILSDHEDNCKHRDVELQFSCEKLAPNNKPTEECNRNCVKDLKQLEELLCNDTQNHKNYTQDKKRKILLLSIIEKFDELEPKDDLPQNNQLQENPPQHSKYNQSEKVRKDIKKMLQELYDISKTNVIPTDNNIPNARETQCKDSNNIIKTDSTQLRKDDMDLKPQPYSLKIKEEPIQTNSELNEITLEANTNKNYPQKVDRNNDNLVDLSVTKDQSPVNMSLRSTEDSYKSRKEPCKASFVKNPPQQSLRIKDTSTDESNKTNTYVHSEGIKMIKTRKCKANCNAKNNRDLIQEKEQPSRDSSKINDSLKTFNLRVHELETRAEMIKNSRLNEIMRQSNYPSQIRKELLKSSQNWQNKHNFSKEEDEEEDRMYFQDKFKKRLEENIKNKFQDSEPCICESYELPNVVDSPTYSNISKRRENDEVNKEKEKNMLPVSGVLQSPEKLNYDHDEDMSIANVIKEKETENMKGKEDNITKERKEQNDKGNEEENIAEKEENCLSESIRPKVLSNQGLGQLKIKNKNYEKNKNYALSQDSVLAIDKKAIQSPSESSYIKQVLGRDSLSKDNQNSKIMNKQDQLVNNTNGSQTTNSKTKEKTDIEPLLITDEFLRPDGFKNLTGKPSKKSISNVSRRADLDQKPSWFKRCCWNKSKKDKDDQQFCAILIDNSNSLQSDYHTLLQTKILSLLNEDKPKDNQIVYDEKNINTEPVDTYSLPQALGRSNTYKKHHTEVIVSIEGKGAKGRRKWNSERNTHQNNPETTRLI